MLGVVGRVKRTPRFDVRGAGLLHFVRNDGCEVGRLPRFARNDGEWVTGLLYFVRNNGCEVGGLPRFARNDREGSVWIALLRSQ